jgi:NAD(P)-dependent dehydrogenase (short-subunit alcohol dehydrogenase family)
MTRKTELAGQIAVITGAGSGIGSATARLLAARGAKVHLADLNAEAAEAVARQIRQAGGSAEAHAVDVADPAASRPSPRPSTTPTAGSTSCTTTPGSPTPATSRPPPSRTGSG